MLLRQLGEIFAEDVVEMAKEQHSLGTIVGEKKAQLASLLGCDVKDLRRDHCPALGAREKVFDRDGKHVEYKPEANDPEFLQFIPHGPQFENSHLIKTLIRGKNGQHSDRVLIARNRRQEEREGTRNPSRKTSHKIKNANRWPPKGFRKIPSRQKPKG